MTSSSENGLDRKLSVSTINQASDDARLIIDLLEANGISGHRAVAAIRSVDGIYNGVIGAEVTAALLTKALRR